VGSALAELVTGGSALAALGKVSLAVCALVLGLIYRRYLGILGADRRKPAERQAYDALRESLAQGNMAARLYAARLTQFLDWIDRFFGDAPEWRICRIRLSDKTSRLHPRRAATACMADGTLFPHAFGLRTPSPLWTAPAFDCCLLLAFIYPVATIFVIWAVSGHVGPAEAALQLAPSIPGWTRWLLGSLFVVATAVILRSNSTTGWKSPSKPPFGSWMSASRFLGAEPRVVFGGFIVGFGVLACTGHGLVAGAALMITSLARIIASANALGFVGSGAGGPAVVIAIAVASTGVCAIAFAFVLAVVIAVAFGASFASFVCACAMFCVFHLAVGWASTTAITRGWQGPFLSLFDATMIATCLIAARLLSPLQSWEALGPWLVFLGLLSLINAPFDWASLGLTRALLRRGLELGACWPYALALVDACLAALIYSSARAHDGRGSTGF
jgi:hypothetical protein